MKKKYLYHYIKIAIIILIVLLIILSFFIGNRIMKEKDNTPYYATVEEIPDVQTLIDYMYGKFIKLETVTNEKYSVILYVDLNFGLFNKEKSQLDSFNSLVTTTSEKLNYQNYRVIDKKKDIELKVMCDSENREVLGYYINDDINFYGHYESQKALANYKKAPIINFNIESAELNYLIQNGWNKSGFDLGKAEAKVGNYVEYAQCGLKLYEIDEKVFNILVDSRYTSALVNGIKVGESLEKIINILGEPTFGNKDDGYIGYKNEDMYIFFNDMEEISVYSIQKDTNTAEFIKLIEQYQEDRSVKKLVSSTTDVWEDYETYYYDEYTVLLTYPTRGIDLQYGLTQSQGVIVYNNYTGIVFDNYTQEELSQMEIEIPSFIYFVEKDAVNEYECKRYETLKLFETEGEIDDRYFISEVE